MLGPVSTKIKTRPAQVILKLRITEKVDSHTLGIRQQQHLLLPGNLAQLRLQPATVKGDQAFRLLAVLVQPVFGNTASRTWLRGVQPIILATARPRLGQNGIAFAQVARLGTWPT